MSDKVNRKAPSAQELESQEPLDPRRLKVRDTVKPTNRDVDKGGIAITIAGIILATVGTVVEATPDIIQALAALNLPAETLSKVTQILGLLSIGYAAVTKVKDTVLGLLGTLLLLVCVACPASIAHAQDHFLTINEVTSSTVTYTGYGVGTVTVSRDILDTPPLPSAGKYQWHAEDLALILDYFTEEGALEIPPFVEDSLRIYIDSLVGAVTNLQQELAVSNNDREILRGQVTNLQTEVEALEAENFTLVEDQAALQAERDSIQTDLTRLQARFDTEFAPLQARLEERLLDIDYTVTRIKELLNELP